MKQPFNLIMFWFNSILSLVSKVILSFHWLLMACHISGLSFGFSRCLIFWHLSLYWQLWLWTSLNFLALRLTMMGLESRMLYCFFFFWNRVCLDNPCLDKFQISLGFLCWWLPPGQMIGIHVCLPLNPGRNYKGINVDCVIGFRIGLDLFLFQNRPLYLLYFQLFPT